MPHRAQAKGSQSFAVGLVKTGRIRNARLSSAAGLYLPLNRFEVSDAEN